MRILFIHGRAQEEFEAEDLMQTWNRALQLSFSDAGLGKIPEHISIDFVYYATDLINLLGQYKDGLQRGKYVFRGLQDTAAFDDFQADFIEDLAKNAGVDKRKALQDYGEVNAERGLGNTRIAISLMRALDEHAHKFANYSIKKVTQDVGAYLVVPEVAIHINRMVVVKLTTEPTIVIAHSLGTIIAYNMLKEIEGKGYDIRLLITLGSPLGVKSVQRQLRGRLSHPSSLKGSWHNIYDPLDYVALNPLDKNNFNITPPITNCPMENESDNRHGIVHYLSHPQVALILNNYLKNL